MEYKVSLLTTNIYFGGTGSDIFYTFVGLRGSTPEHPAPGDKYLGELDMLTFTDNTDIGKFICLNIRMDGSDAWHIQEVEHCIMEMKIRLGIILYSLIDERTHVCIFILPVDIHF